MGSLYAPLLGLGGWFIGVLIALTALPRVPLDDELLTPLSVGLPIGIATYFDWVHRDWSGTTKTTGFAGAVTAALVDPSLGFNAIERLYAVITAIVGAAVGANAAVLALDIAWDRLAHDHVATTTAKEPLEARAPPSTG